MGGRRGSRIGGGWEVEGGGGEVVADGAGGKMPLEWSLRSKYIWPSVMYPVRSGIGCVMSSLGIDSSGICVMEPLRPVIRPARS